ncbi:Zn2Cys6 transcriptional regulator [Trichoderma cornu-damae]|uniref:Zn2Cys6 transcriptional regulator n=1 Tax=Trichoderma cornu-damae TaxID=654480 RepID=A0A9P8QMD9_9HYPO|nr:Zn2Cys6 transcriptional regulator [Trichoderma cornu-damae]
MEQIETQASDLRYLTAPVAALSDSASVSYETPQSRPHMSPGSAMYGDNSALQVGDASPANGGGNKRKSIEEGPGGAKQTRSKRNRYISIACNECKRRKIKCNGETPCQRCGNLNLACLYAPNCCSNNFKDSEEFKKITAQLSRLQDEVNWLNQTMRNMQSESRLAPPTSDRVIPAPTSVIAPSPSQSSTSGHRLDYPGRQTPFQGPTSTAFALDVARETISNMGWKTTEEGEDSEPPPSSHVPNSASVQQLPDPLLEFDKDEMVRLCRVYEDEIGIMYPVLNIQTVIAHVKNVSLYLRSQRPTEPLNDLQTLQLKAVMCCALVVEGHGHCDKATRLYESMESTINRKLMSDGLDVSNLPLLALVAGYRFLANEEVLAWRVMGQVVRLCVELGIHQKRGLMMIQNETERRNALNSFWSAYVLDRRWAFGTGLPYAIQDDEIDPTLPLPDEYPYLVAMITYSRIGAKVWRQVSHFGPVLARELGQEEIDRLDQEILRWYESVPEEIRVHNWDNDAQMTSTPSYNLQRLRIWTYLRFNQIRTWLYTPVLHSATSIMSHPLQAQRVVDLAKDTIQYLHHLNNTTNLYRKTQVFYHQFLAAAISVVFLASVHAPVRFSAVCRDEFYIALDLVKDLSVKSWVSQRLWRTIKSLKDVAPRFGLNPDEDPHSSAALGMIGLARGHMDAMSAGQTMFQHPPMPPRQNAESLMTDNNGQKIQSEMSRIFEGYVGLNGVQFGGGGEEQHVPHPHAALSAPDPQNALFTSADGTVFPHMREMF